MTSKKLLLALPLLLCLSAVHADEKRDAAMRDLALKSGCLTCHSIEAGKPGPNGGAPIGPAWQDVSKKYAGNPHAKHTLLPIVLNGSSPYESHWKGKVSGYAMPPNHVSISEAEADKLVDWILGLAK